MPPTQASETSDTSAQGGTASTTLGVGASACKEPQKPPGSRDSPLHPLLGRARAGGWENKDIWPHKLSIELAAQHEPPNRPKQDRTAGQLCTCNYTRGTRARLTRPQSRKVKELRNQNTKLPVTRRSCGYATKVTHDTTASCIRYTPLSLLLEQQVLQSCTHTLAKVCAPTAHPERARHFASSQQPAAL